LLNLEGERPEDPELCYIDHDDFWELEASHKGISLSEFLSFFQKPKKSEK
jgi:hypothetical protein